MTGSEHAAPASPVAGPVLATARRIALALLALAVLNTLLSLRNWWPTPGVLPDHRLSPEFVALWLSMLACVAWRGALSARLLGWLSAGTLLLVLARYADVTVPSLFGRPVNLYWDGQQIPRFLWVSARELPWWVGVAAVAAVLGLLAALYLLLRWALATVGRDAAPYALRARWTWLPTGLTVAAVVAHLTGAAPGLTWHLVTEPITPTYARQAVLLGNAFMPGRLDKVLPASPPLDAAMAAPPGVALGALRGRDFKLMFLESYGAMAFDHPRVAPQLAAAREQLARDIADSGRLVASAYVKAATFAGASDLSHLSLLSGIDLSDPMRHDLLLTTDRPTLTTLFRRAGYQSVGLYPALSWDWVERRFYGFDLFLDARDLDYRGPPLGYWKIPDQFSLARFDALHPVNDGHSAALPVLPDHLQPSAVRAGAALPARLGPSADARPLRCPRDASGCSMRTSTGSTCCPTTSACSTTPTAGSAATCACPRRANR